MMVPSSRRREESGTLDGYGAILVVETTMQLHNHV